LGPFAVAVDRKLVALFTPVAVRLVPGASRDRLPVPAGQEAVIAAPVAPAVPMGRLNVNAVPWAEISVDGRRVGRTPLEGLSISAGSHRITFYHPAFGAHHTVTVVTANETAHAVMHFTASN
jgi:hypothetical protein